MAKSKHTAEWKIGIVKKYLAGEGSFASLAAAACEYYFGYFSGLLDKGQF